MLRLPLISSRSPGRRAGSRVSALALALALAGGAVVGTALIDAPAQAQSAQYSRDFIAAYEPVAAIVNDEAGDHAAARSQLEQVYAAIENDDDRNAAGSLTLTLGSRIEDPSLQRRGLEMMLESGKVDPEQVGQFHFFVGNLAYAADDYAAARTALQAAMDAGYTEDDPEALIAESYFRDGESAQGLDYLKGVVEQRAAAGQEVPENWLLRGLAVAYEAQLADQATEFSAMLVRASPSQRNWQQTLQVVNALNQLESQTQLDLLRLMLATDTLSERTEFVSYIEAADPRVMSNEVERVLDAGLQKGVFSTSDEYYTDVKRVVDERAPEDRRDAPSLAEEARDAASGTAAATAGDVFLSLASYAEAEEMFQLALEKGGVDRDRMLTRLGIAQAHQNKFDAARGSFEQVSGTHATVARMWTAFVETKA